MSDVNADESTGNVREWARPNHTGHQSAGCMGSPGGVTDTTAAKPALLVAQSQDGCPAVQEPQVPVAEGDRWRGAGSRNSIVGAGSTKVEKSLEGAGRAPHHHPVL